VEWFRKFRAARDCKASTFLWSRSLSNKTGNEVRCNIEARSFNHCCSGKAISITYSECVFLVLGIQNATRMHNIIIFDLSGSTAFFTLSHKRMIFEKKLLKTKCVF